ncbi:MAG: ribonuclease P protein component [Paracoccaceae bacterium]|nr:ribonuclease P protein component [Paracoccaceae bacterium]
MPEAPDPGIQIPGAPESAVAAKIEILKRRADFLACARARRAHASGLILQARRREEGEGADEEADRAIRVGFTCSKKVGKAVARNRAKRRLREVARVVLPRAGQPGWDYVLIGRSEVTASRPFASLIGDLEAALDRIHNGKAK